jgi:hypothetical protein
MHLAASFNGNFHTNTRQKSPCKRLTAMQRPRDVGVGIVCWFCFYPSSSPQVLRFPGFELTKTRRPMWLPPLVATSQIENKGFDEEQSRRARFELMGGVLQAHSRFQQDFSEQNK